MDKSANSTDSLELSRRDALGGVAYSRETLEQLHRAICGCLRGERRTPAMAGYVNPHVFNMARENVKVRAFLAKADIVAVDGLGVALAILVLKGQYQTRTVMTPLFDGVLASKEVPSLKAVLIGSTEPIAAKAAAAMNNAAGNIRVVKVFDGYRPMEEYLTLLKATPADLVLVGMGSPRSEEFLLAASQCLQAKMLWNIGGGTVHFYAGTQPRVPRAVSVFGLQWLWRILLQPSITPRYLFGIPLFLTHLAQIAVSRNKTHQHYENPHSEPCLQDSTRK